MRPSREVTLIPLVDVTVLVCVHRPESPDHLAMRTWFAGLSSGGQRFGMADMVLSGFVRVVTNSRVFKTPTPVHIALDICAALLRSPQCVRVEPGPSHWAIFDRLCRATNAAGPLVPDAYLAALAIEHGCEWVTADRGFSKYPGLTWRHPLVGTSVTNPG